MKSHRSHRFTLVFIITAVCIIGTQVSTTHAYDPKFLEKVPLEYGATPTTYSIFTTQKMSWMEAMNFCHSFFNEEFSSVDLVSIETLAENSALKDYIASIGHAGTSFWVSANKIGHSSGYAWINSQFMSYTNWGPGEPNLSTSNCIMMNEGFWYDNPCETNLNFICEYTAV